MRIICLLFLIYCLLPGVAPCQGLEFYREDLRFEIRDGRFSVDGDYFFCNSGQDSVSRILLYPFPEDPTYGEAEGIKIKNLTTGDAIPFSKTKSGIYFPVNISPMKAIRHNIAYSQPITGNKAEYILLTTQQWGKPFERANYQLCVPEAMKIDSVSIQPDTVYINEGKRWYIWHRSDYMPRQNMIFYFSR